MCAGELFQSLMDEETTPLTVIGESRVTAQCEDARRITSQRLMLTQFPFVEITGRTVQLRPSKPRASLLSSIFKSSIGLRVKLGIGANQHVPNRILHREADLNQRLSKKRASAQIPIKQHSNFRWWCSKAWNQFLA